MTTEWEDATVAAKEEALINWTNPTRHEMVVNLVIPAAIPKVFVDAETGVRKTVIVNHRTITVRWAPGETKPVPDRYSRSLHIVVDCGHEDCKRGICRHPEDAGPRARVCGGAAPLLQREGQRFCIDPAMLTRPEPPRTLTSVAPSDVAGRLGEDAEDPALERARARRAAFQ